MKQFNLLSGLLAFYFAVCFSVHAQKQTNKWYFGTLAGLDFNTSPPAVLTNGLLNTNEGTASISDASGNLLFYTDGVDVRNKLHAVMPNGSGLLGDISTTQSALIIKKPGSTTLYYIFTLPAEGTGNFCYSVVDISLDNGKGDVTTKNTILKNNVTEKMSAAYHCNGTDVWVTIHELNTKSFCSYLVSSAGVGAAVISTTGRNFTKVHGQMKFNTKGTMLAVIRDTILQTSPYLGKSYVDVCQFNNQTGTVTYSYSLLNGSWQNSYGLEFSPDNSKLYVSSYDQSGINGGNSEITQYNLTASNVQASGVSVGTASDPNILRGLQLGSNGKIYVSKSISPFLCEINAPNSLGSACSYIDNAINVDPNANGSMCMLGLPGFIQNFVDPAYPSIDACPSTVGLKDQTAHKLRVHYDQTTGFLVLRSEVVVEQVLIKDLQGKTLIHNNELSLEVSRINLERLPPGVYLIKVYSDSKPWVTKFIKTD